VTDTISSVRRHPWSTDFTWENRVGPFTTLTEHQVAQFDEHGYVVVPSVLDTDLLAEVVDEIDGLEQKMEGFLEKQEGGRFAIAESGAITFTVHIVDRSHLLRDLSHHPTFVGICADLVGPDVNLYWDQAVYKKPEKPRRFPWHQDNGYAYVEPQQYLTIWVALTDATTDNGCPVVAPGFHRMGTLTHEYVEPLGWECLQDPEGAVAAEVPAGGAVVFSSLTPHLTGPNTTDSVRKAYILQYAPTGAEVLRGDPAKGGPSHREPCQRDDWQYPVLSGGRPVAG
jgi:phytanoyl-CoA hydroxylase